MKKKLFISILGLLLSGGLLQAQSAKQFYKAGETFHKGRQFEAAVEQYSRAIELDPDMGKAYIERGKAYNLLGKHAASAQDFDLALALEKKADEQLLFWSGRQWYFARQDSLALERLDQVISLKPKFREAYLIRYEVHMRLGNNMLALADAEKCMELEDDAQAFYNLGRAHEALEQEDKAEANYRLSIQENNRIPHVHYRAAKLYYKQDKYPQAETRISDALLLDEKNLDYLILYSQVLAAQQMYPEAKEVLSRASVDHPDDERIYEFRGDYEMAMNQPAYAIVEYSRAIQLNKESAGYYHKRAKAYESSQQTILAMSDYETLLTLSRFDGEAQRYYEEGKQRIFELNREEERPVITIVDPKLNSMGGVDVSRDLVMLNITGHIQDVSEIASLQVNGFSVPVEQVAEGYRFMASVNMINTATITIEAADVYENHETAIFPVRITETDPPMISMTSPYATDDNVLHLDVIGGMQILEGKISDESQIVSIMVDSVLASFKPNTRNPIFAAQVDLTNKTRVSVMAEDKFGNRTDVSYKIKREAIDLSNNPMGKTWVVFIENSRYKNFASLDGPSKDVSRMKAALADYDIHRVLTKEDMSLNDLTSFFYYDLRDEIRKNRVNSLLIWYAGHGKYINETGYWIPVDATRDVERSYYNINALKASMQGYDLDHTLVITDACETGPSFYKAMRSDLSEPSCDDYKYTRFRSSQVLSSAGYELAVDDSKFTEVFSGVLMEKRNSCVPIESIVLRVMDEVGENTQQRPQFGKIDGLADENGTFFFIPKDF